MLQELEQAVPPEINDKLMSLYDQLLERGRKEGRQETILNAHANGISLEVIRAITGESLEKIHAVLKQHNRL